MSEAIKNRYEFVYFFDVENGNPNGDPDAGNMPRIDPETNFGIITDVCLKRKVRNHILLLKQGATHFKIFVKEKAVLNNLIEESYDSEGVQEAIKKWDGWKKDKKGKDKPTHPEDMAKAWMCKNYYDVRAFGAVMSTGDKEKGEQGEETSKLKKTAGQVRGPIQFNFSRSVEPIVPLEISITRMAVTNEKDLEKERTMGRKHIVPYGLYRGEGYISAHLSEQTGFSEEDLGLFWDALTNMFEHDHSAARGKMCARKLVIFKHKDKLGNAPSHKLFELVKCERVSDASKPAREFSDYRIDVGSAPTNVEVISDKL